jgi:hypothetical protein
MSRLSPRSAIHFATEAAEAAFFACVLPLLEADRCAQRILAEYLLELFDVCPREHGPLAELGHVSAQVVDPQFLRVGLSFSPRLKNRTFVFTPWA